MFIFVIAFIILYTLCLFLFFMFIYKKYLMLEEDIEKLYDLIYKNKSEFVIEEKPKDQVKIILNKLIKKVNFDV